MTFALGSTFASWNDPQGNPLIALERSGYVALQGVTYPDGTSQSTATAVGPPGPSGPSANVGIDVTQNGVTGNGTTDDTTAMQAIVTSAGSALTNLIFPKGCTALLSNITFPSNIILDFTPGGAIKPVTGQTVTINGGIVDCIQQIFFNATGALGYVNIQSTRVYQVYPEWWGAVAGGSATVNTPAIQAAIYGAFGKGRTNASGLSYYNRPLYFNGNYQINAELKFYDVINFVIRGNGRLFAGITQGAVNARIMDAQSMAYGTFHDLYFSSQSNQNISCPLLDIDYNGTSTPGDIRPQFIDFYSCAFNGNGIVKTGVLVAKSGGGAQGSNINFWGCSWESFTQSGLQFGTPTSYAYNAIVNSVFQGDFQGCTMFAVATYGGGCDVHDSSMENGFSSLNFNQIGFDCYFEAPQQPCVVENVRSESRRLVAGGNIIVKNCYTIDQSSFPTPGNTTPVGTIISGSHVGGDGHYYLVTVSSSAFGGLGTPSATVAATGGSSNTIVDSNASWTTNAFVGFVVSIMAGTGVGCYGVITGNTATTITVSSWQTRYQFVPTSITPDATSTFIVEPQWGTQTTSGGITWIDLAEDCVAGLVNSTTGAVVSGTATAYLENCTFPGDRWNISGSSGTILKNCKTNRADWANLTSGNGYNSVQVATNDLDMTVDITIAQGGQTRYQNWTLPRINYNSPSFFTGPFQRNLGTKALVWSVGGALYASSEISACSDVAIGGRSDPFAAASISRNILEMTGMIGRPSPIGVNLNGKSTDIQGGLPSGTGTPGDINLWLGNPTSSGSAIVDGSIAFKLQGSSGHLINVSSNADVQGEVSSVSGTTITVAFTTSYGAVPRVVVTPTTNAGAFYISAKSATGFTITYANSGAQTFDYWVIGNGS